MKNINLPVPNNLMFIRQNYETLLFTTFSAESFNKLKVYRFLDYPSPQKVPDFYQKYKIFPIKQKAISVIITDGYIKFAK